MAFFQQDTATTSWYYYITLIYAGEETHCESKSSCLRTQPNTITPAKAPTWTA